MGPSASILETHGGKGKIFLNCYSAFRQGAVFEKDEAKSDVLADQRPGWAVYQNDCVPAIAAGVGFQFAPNFFDLDPYGECWPVMDAVFAGMATRPKPARVAFVVNDGLRQKLAMKAGWSVGSLAATVKKFGNDCMYEKYLEICKDMVKEKAGQAGYRLSRWVGYYCGHAGQMTHFAAILDR